MKKQAKITLVGAGPGDPELITIKGLKALQSADVVLYDALSNPALLAEAPADALKIYVGCLLYTSPSPRDLSTSRMPSSA